MPFYRDTFGLPPDAWPHAEDYYAGAISLPMFPAMNDADVDLVVAEITRLLDEG
jgi:dTDP-4-amino-4,6-dideoxygalactose transaminase